MGIASMFAVYPQHSVQSNSWFNSLAGEEHGHNAVSHINYLDKSRSSPLHLAVRGGNFDAIRLCIATGAKIDQQQVCDQQIVLKCQEWSA